MKVSAAGFVRGGAPKREDALWAVEGFLETEPEERCDLVVPEPGGRGEALLWAALMSTRVSLAANWA